MMTRLWVRNVFLPPLGWFALNLVALPVAILLIGAALLVAGFVLVIAPVMVFEFIFSP